MKITTKAAALLISALLLINCGGGGGTGGCRTQDGTPAQTFEHVYVSNLAERTVAGFSVSATGALNKFGQASTSGVGSERIVFDPNFSLLYVANKFSSDVSIFKVDASSGALTALAGSPFAVGDQNTQEGISTIAVDPSGKFLFVANTLTGFWAYSVNSTTGALTALPRAPFQVDAMQPTSIAVHRNGKFVYIAGSSIPSSITTYSIDATAGTVAKIGLAVPSPDDPVDMVFDEAGKFLFVANDPLFGDVSGPSMTVFAVNAETGALTVAPGSPIRTLNLPKAIAVVGNFLYVVDGVSGELGIYSIGTDGALLQRSVTLLDNMTHLTALAANNPKTQGGRYLFVTDSGSEAAGGTVTAYSVDAASGNLTQAGLPVSTGGQAVGMVVATTTVNGSNVCTP